MPKSKAALCCASANAAPSLKFVSIPLDAISLENSSLIYVEVDRMVHSFTFFFIRDRTLRTRRNSNDKVERRVFNTKSHD